MSKHYSLSPKQIVAQFLAGRYISDIANELEFHAYASCPNPNYSAGAFTDHIIKVIRLELRRATHAAENYYRIITK